MLGYIAIDSSSRKERVEKFLAETKKALERMDCDIMKKCTFSPAGSSFEGTAINRSADFDMLLILPEPYRGDHFQALESTVPGYYKLKWKKAVNSETHYGCDDDCYYNEDDEDGAHLEHVFLHSQEECDDCHDEYDKYEDEEEHDNHYDEDDEYDAHVEHGFLDIQEDYDDRHDEYDIHENNEEYEDHYDEDDEYGAYLEQGFLQSQEENDDCHDEYGKYEDEEEYDNHYDEDDEYDAYVEKCFFDIQEEYDEYEDNEEYEDCYNEDNEEYEDCYNEDNEYDAHVEHGHSDSQEGYDDDCDDEYDDYEDDEVYDDEKANVDFDDTDLPKYVRHDGILKTWELLQYIFEKLKIAMDEVNSGEPKWNLTYRPQFSTFIVFLKDSDGNRLKVDIVPQIGKCEWDGLPGLRNPKELARPFQKCLSDGSIQFPIFFSLVPAPYMLKQQDGKCLVTTAFSLMERQCLQDSDVVRDAVIFAKLLSETHRWKKSFGLRPFHMKRVAAKHFEELNNLPSRNAVIKLLEYLSAELRSGGIEGYFIEKQKVFSKAVGPKLAEAIDIAKNSFTPKDLTRKPNNNV